MKRGMKMLCTKKELMQRIEERRHAMIQLALTSSFIDERVVKLSDDLDRLIHTYHTLDVVEKH
jgi:stage 0 sporulation regulatory protein